MAKPPETPPSSDIDGVNMDARVNQADRGGHDDPGGAVKHSKDESKARPTESKPPE